jgi:DNA-binding NarL/FixJ family response regulator
MDSLRDDNARLRHDLEREAIRLLSFRRRGEREGGACAPLPHIKDLTPREVQVLQAIAEGLSTKEIGFRLGITFKTAACHRHRLMQKLGVHGTGTLVRLAISHGLVNL